MTTATISDEIAKSPGYQIGYAHSMFEGIIEHLGAAAMQRSDRDDKIIADHIDKALSLAKLGLRTLSPVTSHMSGPK